MTANRFILELDQPEILMIAAFVHKVTLDCPKDTVAQRLLDDLIEQTSCVKRDPKDHGIGVVRSFADQYSHGVGVMNGVELMELYADMGLNYGEV